MVQNFKELSVWQKAMSVVTAVYRLTNGFPKEELYGLTSQIRRSAVSIPSNIAEGRGKKGSTEFGRYLSIAYGSSAELETQLLIAKDLGYAAEPEIQAILNELYEVNRMLSVLMNSLEKQRTTNR